MVVTKLPYTTEQRLKHPISRKRRREKLHFFSQPLQLEDPIVKEPDEQTFEISIADAPFVDEQQPEAPIEDEPPIEQTYFPLEENIVLATPDFMAHFQNVTRKNELTDPYSFKVSNDEPNPEPLNLLILEDSLMHFSDLISFDNLNVTDEELSSIIQDLCSPKRGKYLKKKIFTFLYFFIMKNVYR